MNPKGAKRPSQISLILRIGAGIYLLYLGWDLREVALSGELNIFTLGMAVFGLVGIILLVTAVPPLVRGEFIYPWERPQEEPPQDDDSLEDIEHRERR